MRLSVVIVSYNVKAYLRQCLESVFRSEPEGGMEVFVVDNASSDGSLPYLRPLFPRVTFIENHENVGFSRANNQAIRQARGEYVLLLNPDTILTEHTLGDCVAFLSSHPRAGAVGVAMYNPQGRFAWESRRGLPTPWTAFTKMTGLGSLFPHSRTFGRYYMRFLPRLGESRIEVISGAFNMMRRKALDEVGLLDEDFFMYGEDIDLSLRLLRGGWENWYLPTPILHYKGESTQKSSYRYVHNFYEAMLIFFRKHFRHRYRVLAMLIPVAVKVRAALDFMLQNVTSLSLTEGWEVDLSEYDIHQYPTESYTRMVEGRIESYERGDHRRLGVDYPQWGITILPYDILPHAEGKEEASEGAQ